MKQLIDTVLLPIITLRTTCGEKRKYARHQKVSKYHEHDCTVK